MSHKPSPYTTVLMIASIGQLLMAMGLYMFKAVNLPVVLIISALALICGCIGGLSAHRAALWTARVIFLTLPFLAIVITVISTAVMLNNNTTADIQSVVWEFSSVSATILVETALLFAIPVLTFTACKHKTRFDIWCVRVLAILQVLMAVLTCFYVIDSGRLELLIDNEYYNIAFCIVNVITAVCAFPAFFTKKWVLRGGAIVEDAK